MKLLLMIIFMITVFGSAGYAQYIDASESGEKFSYTFAQFGSETWSFIKQPGEWDAGDWARIGLLAGSTFLVRETIDQPLRDAVLRNQQYASSFPMEAGRMWGELYTPIVLFSGFAIHSLLTDDLATRKIGYEIGQAAIYAGAVTGLLKIAVGRARPYTNEGNASYHPFSALFDDDHQSMPSGHNTVAFVLSTVLSRNAGPDWLKAAAFVPAVLTFISRVYQDKHWLSDDIAGAAIGYFIATWVVDQHEGTAQTSGMTFVPPFSICVTF